MSKFSAKLTWAGFSFNLVANNNEIIATSQVYKTKAGCLNGIESVKTNAPKAPIEDQTVEGFKTEANPKFEVYKDKAGEFRFRLKARNGEIIAVGEGYKAKASCLKGIESVRVNAANSEIVAEDIIADQVVYGNFYTADRQHPRAGAVAILKGRFAYVGDAEGVKEFIGKKTKVLDYSGKFIMPGIIDSHIHIPLPVGLENVDIGPIILCDGKKAILDFVAEHIKNNPGLKRYRFMMEKKHLMGEDIVKEDLDAICPDAELLIQEAECHSIWVNSRILERHGITDETPDIVPKLCYYVRKDGHVTGNVFEVSAEMPIILDNPEEITDAQIDASINRWIEFSKSVGVSGVFESGTPGCDKLHERVYDHLREMDLQGRLPIYVDGCYAVTAPRQVKNGLEELKRYNRKYNTEHLKVHTLKIFMDGTLKIHTAGLVTPYADIHEKGVTAFDKDQLLDVLLQLNEAGLDLHLHTVGEAASRTVLDAVEMARKALGDKYRVKVTCAHLEIIDDADLGRFAELGVYANFTPHWHAGAMSGNPHEVFCQLLGEERGSKMFRCKSIWNTGALVSWSNDSIIFLDFSTWNPYLGMEVGMTRWMSEKTNAMEASRTFTDLPSADEKMSIEEMILGYTINGAKQLGIEGKKGSIEFGKDADFLVFDADLLTAAHEGFSFIKPMDVYFGGKKMN